MTLYLKLLFNLLNRKLWDFVWCRDFIWQRITIHFLTRYWYIWRLITCLRIDKTKQNSKFIYMYKSKEATKKNYVSVEFIYQSFALTANCGNFITAIPATITTTVIDLKIEIISFSLNIYVFPLRSLITKQIHTSLSPKWERLRENIKYCRMTMIITNHIFYEILRLLPFLCFCSLSIVGLYYK